MSDKKQHLRVIAGHFRGRKISFPDVPGLRPTSDRIRETVFNWLANDIRGAKCLDLFAGSGALGFEALSRGASQVTLVDCSPEAIKALSTTAKLWKVDKLTIHCKQAMKFIQSQDEPFDIIFLDPPFASDQLQRCLTALIEKSLITTDTLVYIETAAPSPPLPDTLSLHRQKKAGQVIYGLYRLKYP